MNKAFIIQPITSTTTEWGVENRQGKFKLVPPYRGVEHVFVSESRFEIVGALAVDETMCFAYEPTDGGIDYSSVLNNIDYRSIEDCLADMGYEVSDADVDLP